MTRMRPLCAIVTVLVMAALTISARSHGEPAGNKAAPVVRPVQVQDHAADSAVSRFTQGGAITYRPLQGENYFALELQPKLESVPARKRDYLIMVATAAAQAGKAWTAQVQIAAAVSAAAGPDDRISLWVVSIPEQTKPLFHGFLRAHEDRNKLVKAIQELKKDHFPAGDTDLKEGLARAISTFDDSANRQRILLFLGDGQSTHNPIEAADRRDLIQEMVKRRIAFFPVPLGARLSPENLHGLATGTGGTVLRTRIAEEKLPDALKRYQEAFAGPILYDPQMTMPPEVTQVLPKNLPPLRADVPTLVAGRIQDVRSITYNLTGTVAGGPGVVHLQGTETVREPEPDNYFLVNLVGQWSRARTEAAFIRADRALVFAYENTRLFREELLLGAHMALRNHELKAALRLYEQARTLAPHDAEAKAGIKICLDLQDGKSNRALIQEPRIDAAPNAAQDVDLLQAQRDRAIVSEQETTRLVESSLRLARQELAHDPDGALDLLRNWLVRVKDHPDLGDRTRDALVARLQTALRETVIRGKAIKLREQARIQNAAVTQKIQQQEQARQTIEEHIETLYRAYKVQLNLARLEESSKNEVLAGLANMEAEALRAGRAAPLVAAAAANQVSAAFQLQRHQELKYLKKKGFMEVYLAIDKSNVPFADEPAIYFPPLRTWTALTQARKEKYEVSTLADDDKGRAEATALKKLLEEPIDLKDFQNPMTLKEALGLFIEKFAATGKELPILVDAQAFKEEDPDSPDIYDAQVKFPPFPRAMAMATALRLALSQVPTGNATWLIRRSFIEITTNERMVRDKVVRVYPVGDLVIPISQAGGLRNFNFGGGQAAGPFGQFGQPFGAPFGAPLGQMLGFNQPLGPFFNQPLGQAFGQPFGNAFGQPFGAGFGQPFGQLGNFQGVSGSFNGGSFQGGFSGSLGALGASQAVSLIDVITKVVAPGEWFVTKQPAPFQPQIFRPFVGMIGAAGGPPLPQPEGGMPDIQQANTIEFFPPALALIVRGPSRIHTSVTGSLSGGKQKRLDNAMLDAQQRGLDVRGPKGQVGVAAAGGGADNVPQKKNAIKIMALDPKKNSTDLEPAKIWNEALANGGVTAGMVIATADFLFEAGQFAHAAEFLKANLRAGIVIRPWVYEALALALEASGGDPQEIRRARLSAVSLDPNDAQGFLQAARALADHKQFDRALAFCRQAALLEPDLSGPYADALTYADLGKDGKAMAWAAGKLLARDWVADTGDLHAWARARAQALVQSLQKDKRGAEGEKLQRTLENLRRRDLVIHLSWDTGSQPVDLELEVTEPTGTTCSLEQKQTPGGGLLLGTSLTDMSKASYVAAQAFPGDYHIRVRRLFGQPLGGRARLEIIQNLGTSMETRRLEIVKLDGIATFKLHLQDGRRTELAGIPPPLRKSSKAKQEPVPRPSALLKLRGMASPETFSAGPSGRAGTPGAWTSQPEGPVPAFQPAAVLKGAGLSLTAQLRVSSDQRETNMVLRPVFQALTGSRSSIDLPFIPGTR